MEGAIDAIAPFFWSPAELVGLVGTMIGPIGGWGFWPFPESCVSLSIVIMIMT